MRHLKAAVPSGLPRGEASLGLLFLLRAGGGSGLFLFLLLFLLHLTLVLQPRHYRYGGNIFSLLVLRLARLGLLFIL